MKTKSQELLELAEEASHDFSWMLRKLKNVKPKGEETKSYFFFPSAILKHPEEFNELSAKVYDLAANHEKQHTANGLMVVARINAQEDKDNAFLWDAGVEVKDGMIQVTGADGPSGGSAGVSSATVAYDGKGNFVKVVNKSEKFSAEINPEDSHLDSVLVDHCSDELYELLVGVFGKSAPGEDML